MADQQDPAAKAQETFSALEPRLQAKDPAQPQGGARLSLGMPGAAFDVPKAPADEDEEGGDDRGISKQSVNAGEQILAAAMMPLKPSG